MAVEPIVITITGSSTEAVASVDKLLASLKAIQVETARVGVSMKALNTELAATTKGMQTMAAESGKAGTAAASGARKAETSWAATSRTMSTVGRSMTKFLTVPIIGIGAAAVDMSVKFHNSMLLVQTHAGASHREITKMSKSILALSGSGQYAQAPRDFATSLYQIESAGIRGAKALDTLKASANLAAVGHANFADTTKSVVSVENLALKGTGDLNHVIGQLNATVGAGRLYMDDLNTAIGTGFLTNAKQAGISLRDAGSALDLLTRQGMPAAQAATRLRFGFSLLAHPTDAAAKALKEVGINSDEIGMKMRGPGGLMAGIQDLKDHLEKLPGGVQGQQAGDVLTKAFGGARSSVGILAMVQHTKELGSIMGQVATKTGEFNDALAATKASPVFQLKAAWAQIQTSLIRIGDNLLPTLLPITVAIAKGTASIFGWWDKLPGILKTSSAVLALIVAAAGPLLVIVGSLLKSWGEITAFMGRAAVEQNTVTDSVVGTNEQLVVQEESLGAINKQILANTESYALYSEQIVAAAREQAVVNETTAMGGMGGAGRMGSMAGRGGIAMGGLLASQVVGQAVGGKAGNAISLVGGGAAMGAMFGPWGALAGAAIGAAMSKPIRDAVVHAVTNISAPDIGKLFGGGDHSSMTDAQLLLKKITDTTNELTDAMKKQGPASKNLAAASANITQARKKEHTATQAVHKAEMARDATIKRFGPDSRQALQAEVQLTKAKEREKQATQALNTADRVHGATRRVLIGVLKSENRLEVVQIDALKQHAKATFAHIQAMQKSGATDKQVATEFSKWKGILAQVTSAQSKHNKTLTDASKEIGPKFADQLSKVNVLQADMGRKATTAATAVANGLKKSGTAAQGFGQTVFQSDTSVVQNTSAMAKGFNVPGFPTIALAPPLGKQSGGTIVPGSGSGDKVHMQAMVEPGEGVFVVNRNAMAALSQLNDSVPRFQSGGKLAHPAATGPAGVVKGTAQGAMDKGWKAAKAWIAKHLPTAGMVKFAESISAHHFPYVFGGGHSSFAPPYDCSGYVSAILHAGHLLGSPVTTDGLKTYGDAGPGSMVTIGVRGTTGANAHTMIQIGKKFFESGGGHGASEVAGWDGGFPIKRHPPGMQSGGDLLDVIRKKHPGMKFSMDPHDPNFVGWGLKGGGAIDNYNSLFNTVGSKFFPGSTAPPVQRVKAGGGYTYSLFNGDVAQKIMYASPQWFQQMAQPKGTDARWNAEDATAHEWGFELGGAQSEPQAVGWDHRIMRYLRKLRGPKGMQKGGPLKFHDSVHNLFGTHFDKDELTTLASFVGMPNPSLMGAIAYAESTGNPGATGHNTNGTTDRGLWQINSSHGAQSTYAVLANAMAAKSILGSQGLSAWSTYNNGKYKQFLGGHVDSKLLAQMAGTSKPSSISSSGGKTSKEVHDYLLAHPGMTQNQWVKIAAKKPFLMGKKAARTAYQTFQTWLAKHPGGVTDTSGTSAYDQALQHYEDYVNVLTEAGRMYSADRALSMRLSPVMAGFASEQGIPLLGPYGDIPPLNLPNPGAPPIQGAATPAGTAGHTKPKSPNPDWSMHGGPAKLHHHHHHTVKIDNNGNFGFTTVTKTDNQLGKKSRHHTYAPGH